jgi:DNA-binding NarL/FixJ family response regulator
MSSTIFFLEDHKYVPDSYINVLKHISVEAEMIISFSLQQAYDALSNSNLKELRLAILDYSMPPCELYNLSSGEDIAKIIRAKFPETIIIFISAVITSYKLESLLKNVNPEGIIEKSDVDFSDLYMIFDKVLNGEVFYSKRIHKTIQENQARCHFLDTMSIKIIELLSQGIATKNLPHYLPLSLSGVHKRKARIKAVLNIDKGSDEEIIKEARKQGFI